jgi:outer membrane protein assembly factor BamB
MALRSAAPDAARIIISSLTLNVSRETSVTNDAPTPSSILHRPSSAPARRDRRPALIALAALAAAAITAAACGAPPGPEGWAPAHPVTVNATKTILVPHRAKLFALPDGSTNPNWQFPPQDKNAYPISTDNHDRIAAAVDALDIDAAAKTDLKRDVDVLAVGGESKNVLKDAIDASAAPQDAKDALKSRVDAATKFERSALDSLQALYGDIGVSPDGKTAYVPTYKGILVALDMSNGHARWVRDAGAEFVGGVAVNGDTLYAGTKGNRIYAINAATGESIWTFNTKGEVWATPTYDNGVVYATSLDGSAYAIDAASGQQKWVFDSASSGMASHPVVANGLVYVGAFDNKFYALNSSDGTEKWTLSGDNWFWSTPVVSNGVVYAASLDNKVYAVDASTGDRKWDKPFDAGAPVRSAPVLVDGSLIVASRDGHVYKIDPASGTADGDPIQPASKIHSDLTADGSTVYINPDSAVLLTLDVSSGPLQAPGSFPLPQ